MRVQEFVRFMAVWCHKEVLVYRLYLRVVMRLSQVHMHILGIDCFQTLIPDSCIGRYGLAASAETSSGAGHDLNEVV